MFSFNNTFYEQIDGFSMGSPLGPVIANIFMTELEKYVVKDLFVLSCSSFISDMLMHACFDETKVIAESKL